MLVPRKSNRNVRPLFHACCYMRWIDRTSRADEVYPRLSARSSCRVLADKLARVLVARHAFNGRVVRSVSRSPQYDGVFVGRCSVLVMTQSAYGVLAMRSKSSLGTHSIIFPYLHMHSLIRIVK